MLLGFALTSLKLALCTRRRIQPHNPMKQLRLSSTFLLCSSLACQVQLPRVDGASVSAYGDTITEGYVSLEKNGAGQVELVWDLFTAGPTKLTQVMPFDVAGEICQVALGRFLISGATYTGTVPLGHLLEVQLGYGPRQLNVVSSTVHAGFDFVELEYNSAESFVYAIDHVSRDLLFTPWLGAAPAPGSIATAVGSTVLPLLKRGRLARVGTGNGVNVVSIIDTVGLTRPIKALVEFVGPGWLVMPTYRAAADPQWAFQNWQIDAHGPTLIALAHSGASGAVLLEDVAGNPVSGGSTNPAGEATIAIPLGTLTPGAPYRLVGGGFMPSTWQTINSEWGVRTEGSLKLRRGTAASLYSGNPAFSVGMHAFWDGVNPPSQTPQTYLVIGFNLGAGQVTVDPVTGAATINNVFGIVGPLAMEINPVGDLEQGSALVELPIPAGLDGIEVVFQWMSWDGASWAASEVFGSQVFPAPAASAAAQVSPLTPKALRARLKAAKAWLKASAMTRPTQAKRAAINQAMSGLGF